VEAKQISKAVIKRLPRYYRYLGELLEENVERISSSMAAHCAASRCCIVVPLAGAAGHGMLFFIVCPVPFGLLASVPFCGLADAIGAVDMTLEYLPGLSYRRCVP